MECESAERDTAICGSTNQAIGFSVGVLVAVPCRENDTEHPQQNGNCPEHALHLLAPFLARIKRDRTLDQSHVGNALGGS